MVGRARQDSDPRMQRFWRPAPIAVGVFAVAVALAAVLSVAGAASPALAPAPTVTPDPIDTSPPEAIDADLIRLGPSTAFSRSARQFIFSERWREAASQRAVQPVLVARVHITDPLIGDFGRDVRSLRERFENAERFAAWMTMQHAFGTVSLERRMVAAHALEDALAEAHARLLQVDTPFGARSHRDRVSRAFGKLGFYYHRFHRVLILPGVIQFTPDRMQWAKADVQTTLLDYFEIPDAPQDGVAGPISRAVEASR